MINVFLQVGKGDKKEWIQDQCRRLMRMPAIEGFGNLLEGIISDWAFLLEVTDGLCDFVEQLFFRFHISELLDSIEVSEYSLHRYTIRSEPDYSMSWILRLFPDDALLALTAKCVRSDTYATVNPDDLYIAPVIFWSFTVNHWTTLLIPAMYGDLGVVQPLLIQFERVDSGPKWSGGLWHIWLVL